MTDVRDLRDRFWAALRDRFGDGVVLNGHPKHRLPNTLNVSFVHRVGAELLARLDSIAASRAPPATPTGSNCRRSSAQ